MATDDKVAAEQEAVEKLRQELAELNAPDVATENDVTLGQLKRERESLEAEIAERMAAKERSHEVGGDPLAYSRFLLDRKTSQEAARAETVVLDATGDKKAAAAAKAEAEAAAKANDEKKSGGN